jgi:hypothetical protein
MRFARWVFALAGTSGILILTPLFFREEQFGRDYPPATTHPEFYYGFAGVGLSWQVLFLVIATNPARLRPAMIPAVLEKVGFVVPVAILVALGRVPTLMGGFAVMDAAWAILFIASYVRTPSLGGI